MSEIHNYVDLKVNGRLFTLWIMHNMKAFNLPTFGSDEGYDSNVKIVNKENELMILKKYQAFLGSILSYKSKFKNALVYHGLGAGKTATAINIYNVLYNYNPMWNVFVIIKSSLHDNPWLKDLYKFLPKEDFDQRMANIKFVHYDAPNADKLFLNAVRESDATKQNIYIFDEAHNFIKNVYSNITTKSGKRASTIYEYIMQEKKVNDNSRVLLLTGTPAVNKPYELALLFNLLRPDSFPKTESKFKEIYISVDENNNEILNPKSKNMFQRRILGLTSYYIGSDPKLFASTELHIKTLEMSEYQKDVYSHYEYIEEKMERQSSSSTVYKTYTRQSSDFVFPPMGDYNGENRPRPSSFKISEKEAEAIIRAQIDKVTNSKKQMDVASVQKNIDMYLRAVKSYTTALISYFDNLAREDKSSGKTIEKDVEIFKTKYKSKFKKFWTEHTDKSSLLTAMYTSSCKFTAAIFYSFRSKGPMIMFSNFVKMEGLEILKIYLSHFGFKNFRDKSSKDFFSYTEFHGDIDSAERSDNVRQYNNIENLYGKNIKIILLSPAGAEGIDLKYTRQVHILDPYWNEVRIRQLIGRGRRMDSHSDLPVDERHIDIFRYHAVKKDSLKLSTDEKIYRLAEAKEREIETFLMAIKEAAIDCEIFKNHNMNEQSYSCFKFNESSYFNKLVGPAYKQDIFYDSKINDGLNSLNSVVKHVKTYKIKAKVLNNEDELSDVKEYWYNPKSSVVYDIQYDYPIGKISKTNGIPNKVDGNIYIIDMTINIPTLKRTT